MLNFAMSKQGYYKNTGFALKCRRKHYKIGTFKIADVTTPAVLHFQFIRIKVDKRHFSGAPRACEASPSGVL